LAEPADPGGIDPGREALLGVLTRHRVAFVLIGGAAIQSHGRRFDTQDIDLTPDIAPENLARLADALNELGCQLGSADATSVTVNSPTSLTATSPSGINGTVDVTVWNPSGGSPTSSADEFRFEGPVITNLNPRFRIHRRRHDDHGQRHRLRTRRDRVQVRHSDRRVGELRLDEHLHGRRTCRQEGQGGSRRCDGHRRRQEEQEAPADRPVHLQLIGAALRGARELAMPIAR
jgi:hypothetical protein